MKAIHVTEQDLYAAERATPGVRIDKLQNIGSSRRTAFRFVLRPSWDEHREKHRMLGRRDRRLNAVTWKAHGLFLRVLYARVPNARVESSYRTPACYVDAADFHRKVKL